MVVSWEIMAYVDDLTLIAQSRKALQIMISICEGYAVDYDIIFNCPLKAKNVKLLTVILL